MRSCPLINIFFRADLAGADQYFYYKAPLTAIIWTESFGFKPSCKFWGNLTPLPEGYSRMLTRPQPRFHHHTVSRTIHQPRAESLPATHEVSDNFRRNTLLASLPYPRCNEWGHLNRIYDIFKTWLLRIWELFIRLKHHLSYSECCFGGNKWFCCSFSNELLFIHSSNKPFVCVCVHTTDVIKGNEAQVTTHNQVFFIMRRATAGLK